MSHSEMEKLIQNADFFHDDDDTYRNYNDKIDEWRDENEDKITGSQLLSALKVFNTKLTQGKCPKYKTFGWKQAEDIFDTLIIRLASQLIDNNKLQVEEMQLAYYDLYLEWFHYGPSTVQLEIMVQTVNSSDTDMEDYLQKLTGEPRKKLIAAMMTPVAKKEDTEDEEFYTQHRSCMDSFIGSAFDKSSLLEADTITLWLDYVFHLYLDYPHVSESGLDSVMREAGDRFDEINDGWDDFSDVKAIKALIEKVISVTKSPGFPKNEKHSESVIKPISKLCSKLKKPGDAETFCDTMFDFLEAVSMCKGNKKGIIRIFREVLDFFYNQENKNIKGRISFFKAVAPRFISLLEKLPTDILENSEYCPKIMDTLDTSYANNKTLVADWVSLVVPLLKRPSYRTLRAAYTVISCDDHIRWKEHKEIANKVFQCFSQIQLPTSDEEKLEKFVKEFKSCIDYFIRGLEKSRILKEYGEGLMFLSINILELKINTEDAFNLVETIGEHIEIKLKENKDKVMEVMKRLHLLLQDDTMPWTDSWPLQRAVEDILNSILDPVNDGRVFDDDDLKIFSSMCHTCLSKDALNSDDASMSAHFLIASAIMNKLIGWLSSTKRLGYAVKLIPLLLSKYEDDDENVSILSGRYLNDFATGEAATMTPYLEGLIKIYLDKDDVNILMPINTTYPFNPAAMKNHFQVMLQQLIHSGEPQVKMWMSQIFWTASKKQPELFTEHNMKEIVHMAKNDRSNQPMLLQIIQEVSKRKPERMIKLTDEIIDKKGWDPMISSWLNDMLSSLALYDKSQGNKVMDFFVQSIKSNPHDKAVILTALNSVRLLGFKYPDIIKPRRDQIASLPVSDPDGQSLKQTVLDMVDGKTPDNLRKQMEEQQAAFGDLVDKVEDVEVTVIAVKDDLDKQGQEFVDVKNEISEQGQRLDQVEGTVEDTLAKVEEIDSKTLSHAPYWSRDISKLLNPVTEHDWRLLSSRLGYSNADIRGWAQQADPCMAMLNEWYATRKTSEATYAILTNLQEMDRMDAALIVENAMKKAEAVVEDEDFEYASPPEIFISYQWGHQEEVKLLHRHLAMAGYDCWMDIGQMGGGDKLFEKIDSGMRAAKLVISCVTNKYAKSPNCNREVSLAVGVKKPIIPLLLENCSWPPPGSMGPIFSESLYIQFFQTGKEETNDDRYWPVEKFQELLMQLSVNGLVPDEGKINEVYRNWWIPLEEEIHIDKSKTRDGGKTVEVVQNGDSNESEASPDVFISYQWGKQKNIIKLYQRLTSLGFSCWLDIKQMGGGDSLYDKIDRGIRGSKVVVSCVTKKYAMSANCRREVSLTDALKKPLLPLLLEDKAWPPTGPMSMVMTQLLYIGFQQESAHTEWNGPPFDELLCKINKYASRPFMGQQSSTETIQSNQNITEVKTEQESESKDPKQNEDKTETPESNPPKDVADCENSPPKSASSNKEKPPSQSTAASGPHANAQSSSPKSKSCCVL